MGIKIKDMKTRNFSLALLSSLFFISALAQKDKPQKVVIKPALPGTLKTSCDCKEAVKIDINKVTSYGFTLPPVGYGSVQEITSKSKSDKLAFEAEHNTSWYLLNINFDGEFIFEITPRDTTNDYDFLLYKYTDSSFCKDLQKKHLKPIRSNLSRASSDTKGITGLASNASNEFIGKGIGAPCSKSVKVLKGEKYILVLDNVYPDGKGHTLNFNYIKQVSITGIVLDCDSIPIKSEVLLTDYKGTVIKEINTENDGKYIINTDMKENLNYTLAFSSENSFFTINTLNTKDLKQPNVFTDIRTVLVRLKKGKKYNMNSINFFGGVSILLPSSYSSVEALYKLMKMNKNMKIGIEGHVNGMEQGLKRGPLLAEQISYQLLSDERAKKIYDYMVCKGIEKERMRTMGYAASKMLFPRPKNETESSANRRVEINVISIE